MTKGNQFYMQVVLTDANDNPIDMSRVKKVQFIIDSLEYPKTYDGEGQEVEYRNEQFYIWLTQEETFKFEKFTHIQARVLFNDSEIKASNIEEKFVFDVLKEVVIDD